MASCRRFIIGSAIRWQRTLSAGSGRAARCRVTSADYNRSVFHGCLAEAMSTSTGDRSFPPHPRVGVGAVVLRRAAPSGSEVLLVRRAKEPRMGCWSFPGGGLELAETIVDCAVREVFEETGVKLSNVARSPDGLYGTGVNTLDSPTPFAAADVVAHDGEGRVEYHYAIIEVAARPIDPMQPFSPADDVSEAQWFPVHELCTLKDLTVNCASIATEAVSRFKLPQ